MSLYHRILFLLILPCFVASCNGQGKTQQETAGGIKINPEGKSKLDFSEADGHFDPVYGNVHSGFRDKAGNLWFGTRAWDCVVMMENYSRTLRGTSNKILI